MKNSTIYIIGALVLLAVVVFFVFRKKDTNTYSTTAAGTDGVLQNFAGTGTASTLPYVGETWGSWYARRKAENFSFNTKLI